MSYSTYSLVVGGYLVRTNKDTPQITEYNWCDGGIKTPLIRTELTWLWEALLDRCHSRSNFPDALSRGIKELSAGRIGTPEDTYHVVKGLVLSGSLYFRGLYVLPNGSILLGYVHKQADTPYDLVLSALGADHEELARWYQRARNTALYYSSSELIRLTARVTSATPRMFILRDVNTPKEATTQARNTSNAPSEQKTTSQNSITAYKNPTIHR